MLSWRSHLAVAAWLVAGLSGWAGEPAEGELATAASALEQGLYLFAQPILEKLHEDANFKRRDEVTFLLGKCLFGLKRFDEAARILDDYERAFPRATKFFIPAAYWRARADLERSDASAVASDARALAERARRTFERVLEESVDPELLAGARFFLGVALYKTGEYEKALAAFRRAEDLGVNPSETELLALYLGHCLLKLKDFSEAVRAYRNFAERFPTSPHLASALYGLGEAHYYLGEWQEASSAYTRAMEASSAAGDAQLATESRYARAWALAKLGEKHSRAKDVASANRVWGEALKDFEALLVLPAGPMQTSAVFESGELLFKLGRYGEAAERLMALTDPRRYPTHAASALYLVGKSRLELGQTAEAIQAFAAAIDRAGAKGELQRRARFALAEARAAAGDVAGACAALEPLTSAASSPSVRAEALFEMARIYRDSASRALEAGRKEEAAGFYARAYEALSQLASDPTALAELQADEVFYWRGRSADDRARLEPDPTRPSPWVDRALESYRAVKGSWTVKALLDESALHVFRRDIESAAKVLRELLAHGDLSPADEGELRLRCADAELELGRPSEAIELLKPILEDPALGVFRAEAAFKTAVALARKDRTSQKAIDALRSFLKEYPGSPWEPGARAALGDCLASIRRPSEALAEYEAVLERFPDFPHRDGVELAAGHAARDSGDMARALRHYRSLFARGSDPSLRARARIAEGELAASAGRFAEAHELAREALATAPAGSRASREAEMLRGSVLMGLGRFEEAAGAFEKAAADSESAFRAEALFRQARALAAWGRSGTLARPAATLRKAARLFTEVVQKAPDPVLKESAIYAGAETLVELAAAEEAERRRDSALKELEEARRLLRLSSDAARAALRLKEIDNLMRPREDSAPRQR